MKNSIIVVFLGLFLLVGCQSETRKTKTETETAIDGDTVTVKKVEAKKVMADAAKLL